MITEEKMTNQIKIPEIAVYETDVQPDFVYRTGALFVHANKPWQMKPYGAEERIPNIVKIHQYAVDKSMMIMGSADRHFYEDAELIRNEGGVFEDHCMNGTAGQLRIPELEPQKDIYVRAKDGPLLGVRGYSPAELENFLRSGMQIIFEKQSYDVATNPNFKPAFQLAVKNGLKRIINDGFATDYCDLAAVLRQLEYGREINPEFEVYVVTDAIEEVNIDFTGKIDPDFGKKALDQMVSAGAKLIVTKDVLEGRLEGRLRGK